MQPRIPVFVIAFRDAKHRATIIARLKPLGIKPQFIDAVDGRKLAPEQRKDFMNSDRKYYSGKPMRDGAIGCTLSHRAIWKKIRDEKIPAAIVLEDDAMPTAIAPALYDMSIAMLDARKDILEVVFLSRRFNRWLRRVDSNHPIAAGRPALALQRHADIGTESYFITLGAAEYLLACDLHTKIEVDFMLHNWWQHRGNYTPLYLTPSLFHEDSTPSRIVTTPFADTSGSPVVMRIVHAITRKFNQTYLGIRKRLLFRRHFARARKRYTIPAEGTNYKPEE